jgi:hypothetical protein
MRTNTSMTGHHAARWSIVVTMLAATLACDATDVPQAPSPVAAVPTDEAAIHKMLLTTLWPASDVRDARLVVQMEMEASKNCVPTGPGLVGPWQEAMASFETENAQSRALPAGRDLGRPYELASRAEIQAFFAGRRDLVAVWREFYEKYPESGGFIRLSAAGFDRGRTRALVSIDYQCGSLCGSGRYYFLENLGGLWRPVQPPDVMWCAWVS